MASLRNDPSDRRVFVSAWDPATDGLGAAGQRNVPCPTSFNLYALDGELHSALFLRSSDVFVGLPYDVMGHALLMDAIASSLDLRPGILHVTLAHAHLYEDHYDMARACADMEFEQKVMPELYLPGWSVKSIEDDRNAYVHLVNDRARIAAWPAFNPRPFVVE